MLLVDSAIEMYLTVPRSFIKEINTEMGYKIGHKLRKSSLPCSLWTRV